MISKETIKKIYSISCIEEVIGEFVRLKKSGLNYRGLSPFSQETNPSFVVSPKKRIWKDFSSGKGGNIITFLMEHEHFTYVESLHYLAKKYDIKIQGNNYSSFVQKRYHEYKNLCLIQDYAKSFFRNQLYFTQEGKNNGLSYLVNKRGINIQTIHEFKLGYAPSSYRLFTEVALKKGLNICDLQKSGLIVLKENNNPFDCFRKRIMFPIYDHLGIVIGFGGRIIDDNSYATRYLNSSENDIFQKGKILYGLFQAKNNILKEDFCYLVEGYTDVISLHQSGIKNVVSSSGTSLTIDQILLIKRFTKSIVIFYDGDSPGLKATLRVINMFLEQNMNLRVLFFDNGEDPDYLAKNYSYSQLRDVLDKNSYNFVSFKKRIYEKFHQDDPMKKSFLVWTILNNISKLSNFIQRELYIQETSKLFDIRPEVLISELIRISQKNNKQKNKIGKNILLNSGKRNPLFILERELIHLILNYGNLLIQKKEGYHVTVFEEIYQTFIKCKFRFFLEHHQKIFDQICLQKHKKGNLNFLKLNKEKKTYSLSKWDKKGIDVSSKEERIHQYLMDILLRYKSLYVLKLIQQEILNFQKSNVENEVILKRIMYLTNLKNKLNKKLHRYV
ncbi:DNA primase [Blattabacterium cuenoti]|uniref:DNA primase n=1 Tax=Blattabacterium cuenoti TaxID=1653831 RepID=UPI00163CDF82|nr:DNA primase [Blattabacterium cuenoti]